MKGLDGVGKKRTPTGSGEKNSGDQERIFGTSVFNFEEVLPDHPASHELLVAARNAQDAIRQRKQIEVLEPLAETFVKALVDTLSNGLMEEMLNEERCRAGALFILRTIAEDLGQTGESWTVEEYTARGIEDQLSDFAWKHEEALMTFADSGGESAANVLRVCASLSEKKHLDGWKHWQNILTARTDLIIRNLEAFPLEFTNLTPYVEEFGNEERRKVVEQFVLDAARRKNHAPLSQWFVSSCARASGYAVQQISAMTGNATQALDLAYWWHAGTASPKLAGTVESNMDTIAELEVASKGATKYLYEKYGIRDFGRYPVEMLLAQYHLREDSATPYGVIINPKSDHNGAFYDNKEVFQALIDQLGAGFPVRIVECESVIGIGKKLIQLNKDHGKISFAIIGGHGTAPSITLGDKGKTAVLRVDDLEGAGLRRAGGSFFIANPTIILNSCSTGSDYGVAANMLLTFPGATILAPEEPTSIKDIRVTMDGAGVPRFDVEFFEPRVTRVHSNDPRAIASRVPRNSR